MRTSRNSIPIVDKIEIVDIAELKPPLKQLRAYTKANVRGCVRLIEKFGFLTPILADGDGHILGGLLWFLAAQRLELPELPVVKTTHLSPDEQLAYRIAEQRISELSPWDDQALSEALQHLSTQDLSFDLDIIGFSSTEIDLRIEGLNQPPSPAEESIPAPPSSPVARPSDLWLCGRHRLLCGSALDKASWATLMGTSKANLVFTDPPYNVPIRGHVSGKGAAKHREFAMASGEMSSEEYLNFLTTVSNALKNYSVDGSLHYFCIDWRHVSEMLKVGEAVFERLINICTWVKNNGGMGSFYRSQHELVVVFRNGMKAHRNNIELGRHGRNRSNVWNYAGANSFGGRTTEEGNLLQLHPTVKPVQLVADAILDSTSRRGIVVDCFLGSGSTLLAAERVSRRLYGMELDAAYVDVCILRWQKYTGQTATLESTGQTFSQVAEDRQAA
jgi:DNA modification methylase